MEFIFSAYVAREIEMLTKTLVRTNLQLIKKSLTNKTEKANCGQIVFTVKRFIQTVKVQALNSKFSLKVKR